MEEQGMFWLGVVAGVVVTLCFWASVWLLSRRAPSTVSTAIRDYAKTDQLIPRWELESIANLIDRQAHKICDLKRKTSAVNVQVHLHNEGPDLNVDRITTQRIVNSQ